MSFMVRCIWPVVPQENSLWIISSKWYREYSSLRKKEKIKWSSKNWQCMVVWKSQDAHGTEIKVGYLVRVLAVAVLLYTQQIVIHEQKSKRTNWKKKNHCLSFVRTSYYLAFLVTVHLFPSCQHADNQHQSTLVPISLFFSFVFLSKTFFVSN